MLRLAVLVGLLALLLLLARQRSIRRQRAPLVPSGGAARDALAPGVVLRQRFLSATPAELGIARPEAVWAVAMDMGLGDDVATVTALADGNASLYTTGTFAVIGGFAHARVRAAAVALCKQAQQHLDEARLTTDLPYPSADQIRFYLRTSEGTRTVEVDERALASGKHPLSGLFAAANDLLSELRVVAESAGAD